MRPLQFVRRNPIPVLGAFAVAFTVWVWRDSTTEPEIQMVQLPSGVETSTPDGPPYKRVMPQPPELEAPKLTPQSTTQGLLKLKPGMPRTEVEGLVGAPVPSDISPVIVTDGRATYQTSYEADLQPPATVRPIHRTKIIDTTPVPPARTLVTLEFDATKPGHPLLGVHYPDPLF